jgi:uncharacterized protein (TIGR02270 family)
MTLQRTPLRGGKFDGTVPAILLQHAEDVAALHGARTLLVSAPHVRLGRIQRFDNRIAAHLDGLSVAGEQSWDTIDASLGLPSPSKIFAAASLAIACKSTDRLNRLYALVEAVPSLTRGLVSAFGWAEPNLLRGSVNGLLASGNAFLRFLGISACAVHRVDPGHGLQGSFELPGPTFARALRIAGELGKRELTSTCLRTLEVEDEQSRFWAAWSAVLLGNRGAALAALKAFGEPPGAFRSRALRLSLQAMDQKEAIVWLRKLAANPENLRSLILGSGIAGDPHFVPWLIKHMGDPKTARLAGEAFSLITGLDLAYLDLERKPPEGGAGGPNDDPSDPNVAMDEDDGLPWPDPERISRWWDANGSRFTAGSRYFLGAPLTRESCTKALKEGFQRQRILAAHYLCLLEPGTVLFEWRAPSPRQERLLAGMG